MRSQIQHCPYCGGTFDDSTDGDHDSRIPAAYRCETCDAVLEIQVNRFAKLQST